MYSFEIKFLWSFCSKRFPKANKRNLSNLMLHQRNLQEFIAWFCFTKKIYLADPLGIPIQHYQILYCRLVQFYNDVTQSNLHPGAKSKSKLCGLFCIEIAHVMFGYEYPLMLNMNDNDLLRFANHVLQHFFN